MPKKPVFSKEQIFEQAFALFENEGLEVITARNVGKVLNSSPATLHFYYRFEKRTYSCCKK